MFDEEIAYWLLKHNGEERVVEMIRFDPEDVARVKVDLIADGLLIPRSDGTFDLSADARRIVEDRAEEFDT